MDWDDGTLMMIFIFGALLLAAWLRHQDTSGDGEDDDTGEEP